MLTKHDEPRRPFYPEAELAQTAMVERGGPRSSTAGRV